MKLQQPRYQWESWPQAPRDRRYSQVATDERMPRGGKIFPRQRTGRPVAGRPAPMVMRRAGAGDNDVAKGDGHAGVMYRRLIRAGEEEDRRSLRTHRRTNDPRETVTGPLSPQPGQFNSPQLALESTLS